MVKMVNFLYVTTIKKIFLNLKEKNKTKTGCLAVLYSIETVYSELITH